jgi:PAS domain S-box-containing protein
MRLSTRLTVAMVALALLTAMAATTAVSNSSLLGGLATLFGGLVLAIVLARSLTRPLVAMTRAVEAFAGDQPMAVPIAASGEIGMLARAFARMAEDVREKAAVLKRAVDERSLADEKFHLAVEASPNGIVMVDAAGAIVLVNAETERLFGYQRDELIGQSVDVLAPAALRGRHRLHRADFALEPRSRRLGEGSHLFGLRKDGSEFPVEIGLNPIRTPNGLLIMSVIIDITESKKARGALLESERQLQQSQKMEAIGQLTGGVAHDFNNILTVITGTIDILSDAVHDQPELAAITKLISEAADRGAELTGHLLAFASKQPLRPRATDVNGLIANAQKLVRPVLGANIEIVAKLAGGARWALVDPTQLSSALLNLAVNARDAMAGGGKLTFETSNVYLDQSYADSNAGVQPGNYLMIAVSDTGSGIPEAVREKVFEPFFSTKAAGKGTGLGLSMVYGFVKQSGGHIRIYSEVGHGTTIRIYLPQAGGQPQQQPAETTLAPILEGGSETVLLVEDDPLVRKSVTRQLESIGYRTIAAADGAEALAVVDSGAAFDLLFTDVIMTGTMNGRQLANEVAKRRPGVNVLFTSGYTEDAIVHRGRPDPGALLLAKPYRKVELARMVRTAIDAGGVGTRGIRAE